MKFTADVRIMFEMNVTCPVCDHEFDLVDADDYGFYAKPIFENRWEDLDGEEVTCPECDIDFKISQIEYQQPTQGAGMNNNIKKLDNGDFEVEA